FQLHALRAVLFLKLLLGLVQRRAAVHQLDNKVLMLLEAVVAQADRVFDDVIRPALVFLRGDVQVAAHAHFDLFAAFEIAGGGRILHCWRLSENSHCFERGSGLSVATSVRGGTTMLTLLMGMSWPKPSLGSMGLRNSAKTRTLWPLGSTALS